MSTGTTFAIGLVALSIGAAFAPTAFAQGTNYRVDLQVNVNGSFVSVLRFEGPNSATAFTKKNQQSFAKLPTVVVVDKKDPTMGTLKIDSYDMRPVTGRNGISGGGDLKLELRVTRKDKESPWYLTRESLETLQKTIMFR